MRERKGEWDRKTIHQFTLMTWKGVVPIWACFPFLLAKHHTAVSVGVYVVLSRIPQHLFFSVRRADGAAHSWLRRRPFPREMNPITCTDTTGIASDQECSLFPPFLYALVRRCCVCEVLLLRGSCGISAPLRWGCVVLMSRDFAGDSKAAWMVEEVGGGKRSLEAREDEEDEEEEEERKERSITAGK